MRELKAELYGLIKPKSIYGIWDCEINPPLVEMEGFVVHSKDLAEFLKGFRQAVIFAATLGAEADALIRRYSARSLAKAVAADELCGVILEEYCGTLYPRRFSPGYGDFHISHQKDIIRLLDCGKRIGLTVTDGYMLAPCKSVTAVAGIC
jgi:hypothetical protein